MRIIFCGLATAALLTLYAACAGARRVAKSDEGYFDVLEANVTRTMPGREESKPSTSGRVILVWRSEVKPSTFFLQPDAGSLLGPARLRKGNGGRAVAIDTTGVRSGDTLTLYFAEAAVEATPPLPKKPAPSTMYFLVDGAWRSRELPMLGSKPIQTP